MANTLDRIQAPIAAEMAEFEVKFRQSMQTRVLLLDKIMGYIVRRKGKQVRPMFVFLTARASAADPSGPPGPTRFPKYGRPFRCLKAGRIRARPESAASRRAR